MAVSLLKTLLTFWELLNWFLGFMPDLITLFYNVSYHPLVNIVYLLLEPLIIRIVHYYPYQCCIAILIYNLPLES